jgi:hypothetical protein
MNTKKIIVIAATVVAAGMAIMSGLMKLSGSEEIISTLGKVGVAEHLVVLGLMEIVFAALFIYSKTMRLGFILLSCYFSGALATELSHQMPLNALMPLILIWIAAFLRDPQIFLPGFGEKKIA